MRRRSRLVAQNYGDDEDGKNATKAPTVHWFSQRLLLSLAASMLGMATFTGNVTQGSVQSESMSEREVYISAPPEIQLSPESVVKVVRPIYGIPESDLNWYLTYRNDRIEHKGVFSTTTDPYIVLERERTPHRPSDISGA